MTAESDLLTPLKRYWGYGAFRPLQERIVRSLIAGHDTCVVMPTLLSSPQSATILVERLELHHLTNPDPNLRFALLTDFSDAPAETMPEDESILRAALDETPRGRG